MKEDKIVLEGATVASRRLVPRVEHRLADCDKLLRERQRAGVVVSNFRAQDGDEWTCDCGLRFVHVCDEADGCCWEPDP